MKKDKNFEKETLVSVEEPQPSIQPSLTLFLKESNIKVTFHKLSDKEWFDRNRDYAPIFEDWDLQMYLSFHYYEKNDFDLSKIYTALYSRFGSHNNYDDYKCSFAYRFQLDIEKEGKKSTYLLALMDVKGNMPYFTYYRKPDPEKDASYYHSPLEEEFSKKEMKDCTLSLITFLRLYFLSLKSFFNDPFYRVVPAAYIIYGFMEGEFFQKQYPYESEEDSKNFQKEITRFKENQSLDTPMSKLFWKFS